MIGGRRRPWRRRVDAFVLRWQARLDDAWADRFLPWGIAGVLTVLLFVLADARARSLDAGSDLAAAVQACWLIAHGHAPDLSITGAHLLAQHLPIGLYPVAWATRVLPATQTLLALQAAGIGLGVVPLWRLSRRVAGLRVGPTVALVLAFAASPTLNDLNLADFHPDALAVAPLLAAIYLALRRRWVLFAVAGVGVAIWSAELALVVAGIGLLVLIHGDRRAGARIMTAGVVWTLVAVLWLEPRYGSTGFIAPGAFGAYGSTFFGAIGGMAVHPFKVVGDLLAEDNVRLLVGLFAPLLFLPVLAPKYLIPAIPLQALELVAVAPARTRSSPELVLPLTVFAFVAAVFALQRMGRRSIERVNVDRRVLIALVAATVGFFAISAGNSPYRRPWNWGRQDATDQARHAAVHVVGRRREVRASPSILPLVAARRGVYELGTRPDPVAATRGVTAVLLDQGAVHWTPREWLDFDVAMLARGFQPRFTEAGITVYESGTS